MTEEKSQSDNRSLSRRLGATLPVALTLTAGSTAYADVHFNVDVNPFGWGVPPPPVVYESPRYYAPLPVVYYGLVVGGTIATGAGATMIEVGRDIMMEAMVDADISGAGAPAS